MDNTQQMIMKFIKCRSHSINSKPYLITDQCLTGRIRLQVHTLEEAADLEVHPIRL